MKTKRLYCAISVLFCMVLLLAGLFICWQRWTRPFKYCDTAGWKICSRLKSIHSRLKNENIQTIIFCKGSDTKKADNWSVAFEVPQECLDETIALLDKAISQSDIIYSMNPWGHPALRVFIDGKGLLGLPKVKFDIVEIPVIEGKGFPGDGLKIITDKGKYLVPASWSSRTVIQGVDWASCELPEYLKKYGWQDLIEPIHDFNQPSQKPL